MQKVVSELLRRWDLPPYLWNLILISASLLAGIFLSWILARVIRKQAGKQLTFNFGYSLIRHLAAPTSLLLPLLIFDNLLPLLDMSEALKRNIDKADEIVTIIGFSWLLIRSIRVAQDVVHNKININTTNNLRQRQIITQLIYIRRVLVSLIVLLTIGAVLLSFDTLRKIGAGLLTGVGIGGIIVGFAAQRSLANLLAGFQIAFTQPIRIDDEVVVENEFGKIEELTLTYVVVRLWDNRRLILPITYFLEKPFQNWTRTSAEILGTIYFYVDYRIPVDWVRQEFLALVQNHSLWDKRAASLVVTDLKTDVMELRALISASSSGNAYDLRCFIREQLIKRIADVYPDALPKSRMVIESKGEKPVGETRP
jgi:small-conductance mechanosensitive channel